MWEIADVRTRTSIPLTKVCSRDGLTHVRPCAGLVCLSLVRWVIGLFIWEVFIVVLLLFSDSRGFNC